MAYVFDVVDPTELQAYVRNLTPETWGFYLGRILPDRFRNTVDAAFTNRTQVRPEAAPYRAFDTPPMKIPRPGF